MTRAALALVVGMAVHVTPSRVAAKWTVAVVQAETGETTTYNVLSTDAFKLQADLGGG